MIEQMDHTPVTSDTYKLKTRYN